MSHLAGRLALPLVSALCLLTAAPAQNPGQTPSPSVLQVNGTFHFTELGTVIPNPSTPLINQAIWARRGQAVLRSDQTFNVTSTRHEAFAVGGFNNGPDNGAGTYTITPDARTVLDFAPSFPGTFVRELCVNTDATMMVPMRGDEQIESVIGLSLRTSSGQSNASLNGRYHLFENRFGYETNGRLTSESVKGVAVFDGAGSWTFSGEEQVVNAAGVATRSPVSDNGPYSVASDGAFRIGGSQSNTRGAISPNGEVFFLVWWDTATPDEVAMIVGMRIGASYDMNALAGGFRFSNQEVELGTQSWNPNVYTEVGDFDLSASTATTGTFAIDSRFFESAPTGTNSGTDSFPGTTALQADGIVQLTLAPTDQIEVAFAASGELFATAWHDDVTGMVIGLKSAIGSREYGTPTHGSGGIAPAAGMRGFPLLGDQSFALRVVGGLGGAPAVLPISIAPSAGQPFFGGMLWFNLNRMIVAPSLGLSGPRGQAGAGEATMPLALPTTPSLAGGSLYVQALVLDFGAPGNLAMSKGLRVRLSR